MSLNQLYVQPAKADGSWVWVRNTVTGAWGEAVVGTGDAIYVARKTSFYRYVPADNGWTALAAPPNPDSGDAFKTGTALAWDFSDYIYALYGAATGDSRRWFYRYSFSSNSWKALANTTADQGEGDAITWVGIDSCIYATIGGEQRPTHFVRYDPATNSWSDAPAESPAGMGDGASLVWTGGDFLYALRGEFDEESPLCDFWRYNLVDDVWTVMEDIPADARDGGMGGVGDGASLLYVGFWLSNQTECIYALSGNQAYPEKPVIPDNRTYRYTISVNSWERLADLPFGVGYYVGCRLGYAGGHIYAWQGTPSTWTGGGDDLAKYEFPPSAEGTPVGGYIYEHTTWTLDGSPYIVVEDVVVEPSVTLTIEPGVVVKFMSGMNLVIDGALVAEGNTKHRIMFTSNSTTPAPGDWGSICFRDSSDDALCKISYGIIEHGTTAVFLDFSSPRIHYCNISDNSENGIQNSDGSPTISGCLISENKRGILIEGADASPTISKNKITDNAFDGILCSWAWGWSGPTNIHQNVISFNGRHGITCDISHNILISNNTVLNNTGCGISSNRLDMRISRNIIKRNQYGVKVTYEVGAQGSEFPINYNHICENTLYDLCNTRENDLYSTYNWWGTTNETLIEEHIYDYYDDYNFGRVFYMPYLVPPVANFTFLPETPYVCGAVTFDASASFNPYGSIINYTWDFGDGNITTIASPTRNHSYGIPDTYNITLTVTDEFGLTNSTVTSLMVVQDDVAPVTIDDYNGAWHNADFTITLTATDFESGVAETYYKINEEPTKSLSVDGQPHITTESANNTMEYWSVDNAGNEELPHKILTGIKLDRIAPTIGIPSRIPEGDIQPDQEVRVSVNVTDFVSGVKNVTFYYTIDNGSTWEDRPMNFNLSTDLCEAIIPGQPAGTWVKYKIIAYDNAGNFDVEDNAGEYYAYAVIPEFPPLDTTPPTISILSPENKTYATTEVPLASSVDEAVSWMAYSLDNEVNMTITGNTTLSGLSDGRHSIVVYVRDIAGNTGASEMVYFSIETSQPEPFPTWIVVGIVVIAVVGVAALVYFAKVKKTTEKLE